MIGNAIVPQIAYEIFRAMKEVAQFEPVKEETVRDLGQPCTVPVPGLRLQKVLRPVKEGVKKEENYERVPQNSVDF